MRGIIIFLIIVSLVGGGYYALTRKPIDIGVLMGETTKVHRGDLAVEINASGNIKPANVTQIKSKASGEVIAIPFEVGSMVKKGELVVRLRDVDEKNSVDRAKSDWERAKIQLTQSQIEKEQVIKVTQPTAEANVSKAEAQLARAAVAKKFQDDLKTKERTPRELVSESTEVTVDNQLKEAEAMLRAAKADLEQSHIRERVAEQNILTAMEAEKAAKKTLDDAEERLRETQIYSPIDGMVLTRSVQIGEVIQGGKTMFTGGTVLMEIADVSQIYAVVNVDEADIGSVRQLAPASARPGPTASRPSVVVTTGPAGEIVTSQAAAEIVESTLDKGEKVEVKVETFKDEPFEGMIERISPQSDNVGGIATFKVWIRITSDNRDKLVGLLNTQAEAHFTSRSVRDALLVSYDAFQRDPKGGEKSFGVFVPVIKPGQPLKTAEFRPCKFGPDNGIDVQVLEGLKEGDEVYVKLPQKTQKEKEAEEKSGS